VAAKKGAATRAGSGKVPSSPRQSFSNWQRVPGPAKQYKNTKTGEVLSNRQYRQQFLYQGKTLEAVQATRGQPLTTYNRLLRARRDYLKAHGITADLQTVRRSAEMQSIVRDLKRTKAEYNRLTKRGRTLTRAERQRLYGPDSAAARALADIGYRDPNAKHWVGDS